jgi:hypothetical protein
MVTNQVTMVAKRKFHHEHQRTSVTALIPMVSLQKSKTVNLDSHVNKTESSILDLKTNRHLY